MRDTLLILLSALVASSAAWAQETVSPTREAQPAFDTPLKPDYRERFNGTVRLKGREGQPQAIRIVIRDWSIENRQHVEQLENREFTVAQLIAGDVTTIVSGERRQRKVGEFWVIPESATMTIETGNDHAILRTVTVRPESQ